MQVSTSAFYAWLKRPAEIVGADQLQLYRRMKQLFKKSRENLGSREMMKKRREEGFQIGRYRVRGLMVKLGLVVESGLQSDYGTQTQRCCGRPPA